MEVPGFKPTAHFVIDSTKTNKVQLTKLEELLYGTDEAEPTLPTPEKIIEIMKAAG